MALKTLRRYRILTPIFAVRDKVWDSLGLFKIKAAIKQRIFFCRLKMEDALFKRKIRKLIFRMGDGSFLRQSNKANVVVSLTSYGKRVNDTLPCTIYSLLQQSLHPKHIAVFLDDEHWNDRNLPFVLKKLRSVGVEFYFVKDIKSYKKLIPALKRFSKIPIITVDDDFYYNSRTVEWLYSTYEKSDHNTVIGMWGCIVERDNNEKYISYNKWKDCRYGDSSSEYSLFSGYGSLYPNGIFDKEILNEQVFMKLAPTADDLWFWAMEKRLNIKVSLTEPHGYGLHRPINRIEEYDWSQKGTLMFLNVVNGNNDKQFENLVEYYNL